MTRLISRSEVVYNMENVSISAHSVKEIRLFRGTDDLSQLLRIMIVGKDGSTTDISLFGEYTIPPAIVIDENCEKIRFDKINFIGDIIEEEE